MLLKEKFENQVTYLEAFVLKVNFEFSNSISIDAVKRLHMYCQAIIRHFFTGA